MKLTGLLNILEIQEKRNRLQSSHQEKSVDSNKSINTLAVPAVKTNDFSERNNREVENKRS